MFGKTKNKKKKRKSFSNKYLLDKNSSFLMKEDYRTLRTNLAFSFATNGPKVIAITSASRSEGKSTNSINLAISCAEIGKKVILIECDLRLPTILNKLGIKEGVETGLTNYMVEDEALDNVIYTLTKYNLDIIAAGTLPPDPTRLLQSSKMKALIESLKKEYDYIILDCPPVNAVIDATLLAPLVDGYVLVIKHKSTEEKDVSDMIQQLRHGNAKILGFLYVNQPMFQNKYYQKVSQYYYGKK